VWDEDGREFIDYVMGLGAVALGYGHPVVNRAAIEAVAAGVVGPLPPPLEETVANLLCRTLPGMEQVRFLKTGAEAVQAAVRLARVHTRRDTVLTCGYHGWLDWSQSEPGVPQAIRELQHEIPFNQVERSVDRIRQIGLDLAAVVIEPVVDGEPDVLWLDAVRAECERVGAVVVFDEIKTAFRIALGGGAERYGIVPDLMVVGKALANGFPLAAVGGRRDIMSGATRTWISSTLATEQVSLAAAEATVGVMVRERVPEQLHALGSELHGGLTELASEYPTILTGVRGLPEMCYLEFADEAMAHRVVRSAAARGVLWKPNAYNFVSTAHEPALIDQTLDVLAEALAVELRGLGQ
jgi:glutamate-1-semialdehyde 2,1-aminomutase